MTPSFVSTGTYDYTFDTPLSNANYGIQGQIFGGVTDANVQVSNVTVNGFRIVTGLGDNGTTPDVPTNFAHSVFAFGVPLSGNTPIEVVSRADFDTYTAQTENDLDGKIDKVSSGTTGNVTVIGAGGNLNDSGFSIDQLTGGTGSADGVVSGATLNGTVLELSRTEGLSDVTVDLAALSGSSGGGFNLNTKWKYEGTSGNPSSGEIKANSNNPNLINSIRISDVNDSGADVSNFLAALSTGDTIYLQNIENAGQFGVFDITSIVDNGSFYTFAVTVDNAGSTFDIGKEFVASFLYRTATSIAWGQINGTLSDQTDLQAELDAKLNNTDFNIYTGDTAADIAFLSGATDLKLNTSDFNAFSATTNSDIATVSAQTVLNKNNITLNANDIAFISGETDTRLNDLNTNKVDVSGDTVTGDLRIEGALFVTGTSATTNQLENAVLLGAITSDGKVVKTNTPALNVSEEVIDISGSTTITELSGIYYVDTSAGDVTLQIPDSSPSNDVSRLTIIKQSTDLNVVNVTTTGGTQLIGRQTTQVIQQNEKGITIVSDADNSKWLVTVDSRFPDGEDEGTLLRWDNVNKVWQSTTNDVTYDNTGLTFTVGGNSNPPTFQVNATDDIVYINTTGLTGLIPADDLGFYAGGRGAFGNSVTLDRLRNNTPANQPRSLSLIDTNSTFRIWRYVNDGNDPAVEFIWGLDDSPDSPNNAWWDIFLDGDTTPDDSFVFRRRTLAISIEIMRLFFDRVEYNVKQNLGSVTNSNITEGDFWYDGAGLFFRDTDTTYNLLDSPTAITATQVRRTTDLALPATFADVTFDTIDVQTDSSIISGDTVNTDNLVVGESGLFMITYEGIVDGGGAFRVRVNDTTVINGSTKNVFSNVTGIAATTRNLDVSNTFFVELSAGDFITLQAQQDSTGTVGASNLLAGATFKAAKLDSARGATGPKGDKGDAGDGAAIIVEDNTVNPSPTGGSYTVLNFGDGLAAVDAGDGQTVNISAVTSSNPTANKIQLLDAVGGQSTNDVTPNPITWDTQQYIDSSIFSHTASSAVITVLQDGTYELSYNVNSDKDTSGTRANIGVAFRVNGGAFLEGSQSASYLRNSSNDIGSNSIPPLIVDLTASDTIEVVAFRLGDGPTVTTVANQSFIRINYLG
jgi:hypothetical protein